MSVVVLFVTLLVAYLIYWIIKHYVPDAAARKILVLILVVFVIAWLVYSFGLFGNDGPLSHRVR